MPEKLSASNAARLMACPASANLELAIPNWQQPARVVGGAADTGTDHHTHFESLFQMSGTDILNYAELLAYVGALRKTRRFKVLTEYKMETWWLKKPNTTTADLVLHTQDELHILDPKTGKIPVYAFGNEQLLTYAACASPLAPKAKKVTLHILQPWADSGITSWEVDTNQIKAHMNAMAEAERKILAGDTTFGPSDHCTFCPANPHGRGAKGKPFCPAMLQVLYPHNRVDEDEVLAMLKEN